MDELINTWHTRVQVEKIESLSLIWAQYQRQLVVEGVRRVRHLCLFNQYVVVGLVDKDTEWVHRGDLRVDVLIRSCKVNARLVAVVETLLLV